MKHGDDNVNVLHMPKTWPPGTIMQYDSTWSMGSQKHLGFGIVVANDGQRIGVVWDARCWHRFVEYNVEWLNIRVISRVDV